MNSTHKNSSITVSLFLFTILLSTSCSKVDSTSSTSSTVEDTSTSGVAGAAAGGALSSSSSGGTIAMNSKFRFPNPFGFLISSALATNACPTYRTTGSGCTATSSTMWLTDASCNYGESSVSWAGTQALIRSTGSATCGTFPGPVDSGTLIRQMVSSASSTSPASLVATNSFGTSLTIDDATANLGNFDQANSTVSSIVNSGYGSKVTFNSSGARTQLVILHHIKAVGSDGITKYDHSVDTGNYLTITETAGASTRTISGSVNVFHNLLKIIATSTFNNVTHEDGCCTPVSGTINTVYASAGNSPHVQPTTAGATYVGLSESLTYTGCGTATFTNVSGTSSTVDTSQCL